MASDEISLQQRQKLKERFTQLVQGQTETESAGTVPSSRTLKAPRQASVFERLQQRAHASQETPSGGEQEKKTRKDVSIAEEIKEQEGDTVGYGVEYKGTVGVQSYFDGTLTEKNAETTLNKVVPATGDRLDGEVAPRKNKAVPESLCQQNDLYEDSQKTSMGATVKKDLITKRFITKGVTVKTNKDVGGIMQDLSGYKDLSKPPLFNDEDSQVSEGYASSRGSIAATLPTSDFGRPPALSADFGESHLEMDADFSNNVRTLIRLVNDLPEGVTKQTGAQIIRLTMEAMGISMEDVLTEAQSAQSEMLDAVRANIKKIEEYKTVIRKLESDIKYYQGKANELSEIIDLFILSNASSTKLPNMMELAGE